MLIALLVFDLFLLGSFAVYALADLVRVRSMLGQVTGEIAALEDHRQTRLHWIAGRLRHPESVDMVEIEAQVSKLSSMRMKARTLATIRTLGLLRFGVDFIMPPALGITAAAFLLCRIV